jgi:hypothetical protein
MINNIFNLKVINLSRNSSLNLDSTLHKGNSANQESTGGSAVVGDGSVSLDMEVNTVNDPDLFDQASTQV